MNRNSKIALTSASLCGLFLVLFQLDIMGLMAMMGAVLTMLVAISYGLLALSGRDDGVFDAYEKSKKDTAKSLRDFFDRQD
ncbi:hypothetical protein [Vibrio sp. WXL103]|uniref:hypothetical protein n=1 Tax=unclassified Vibrio TaxID=2614977 RepID=UPI003EC5B0A5